MSRLRDGSEPKVKEEGTAGVEACGHTTVDIDSPDMRAGLAERGTRTRLDDRTEVHHYSLADILSVPEGETPAD